MAGVASRLEGDVFVGGTLGCRRFTAPDGSITNDAIEEFAQVEASKLQHEHRLAMSQESATALADERRIVHVGRAEGTVLEIVAGAVTPAIGGDVGLIDLLKDGVSILTGPIILSAGHASYELIGGSIASAEYGLNDVFELDLVLSTGGGTPPAGVFAQAISVEQHQ